MTARSASILAGMRGSNEVPKCLSFKREAKKSANVGDAAADDDEEELDE